MDFKSTRGMECKVPSAKAIINGISKDGGLYVPNSFPKIYQYLKNKKDLTYEELAFEIISKYFTDIDDNDIKEAISEAYSDRFKVVVHNNFLELYHGPTCAFKDAALLFLPQIMKKAKKICNKKEEIVILAATSGDTGKAALEGFKNIDEFKVVVYYPKKGVSAIQERQMVTQKGNNVKVIGINGNFDDAQKFVKQMFGDNDFKEELLKEGVALSSANSINIGRLIPQIVYYFYGYFNLVKNGRIKDDEEINVVVPTGNFGNILASYYAKQMGLPIDKFICASNENKVLTDFFNSGVYDKRRELVLTESPSMDILVSSNLERLLFEASGRNPEIINNLMNSLNENGMYEINDDMKNFMGKFYGGYATHKEVYDAIKKVYAEENYLMDTHTAVGYVVKNKYEIETKDNKEVLIASTASPFKFPKSICSALGILEDKIDDFQVLNILSKITKNDIPDSLVNLSKCEIIHNEVWDKSEMKKSLLSYLKSGK